MLLLWNISLYYDFTNNINVSDYDNISRLLLTPINKMLVYHTNKLSFINEWFSIYALRNKIKEVISHDTTNKIIVN